MSPRKKKEPYKFSAVDSFLSSGEGDKQEPRTLPLEKIVLPPQQPRRYFDLAQLENLTRSVREKGILSPLLVRPLEREDVYELVAGERRLRAAKACGLAEVPVFIRELNEEEAQEIALMENLQRDDLNPLEETEGVLALLSRKLKISTDEVSALFGKAAHPEREGVAEIIASDDWQLVEQVCGRLGVSPESFRKNRLPLLKLPTDVKLAMLERGLEMTKALEIARIGDDGARQELLAEVEEGSLSFKVVKARVRDILHPQPKKRVADDGLEMRVQRTMRRFKKQKPWVDPAKRERLEQLLSQIDDLLE